MALDKLRFHNILTQEMGVPPETAGRLTETVDEGIRDSTDPLATSQELNAGIERLRLEFIAELQSRLNSHLRWVMTMWGSAIAAIVGLAVAVILRG